MHPPPASDEAMPPIFLPAGPNEEDRGVRQRPSRLARLFKLDVYGTSLLSRRAAFEMNRAALVLLIILAFETTLWAAVFNLVFYADINSFGGWTIAAILFGLVFGFIIVAFDQSFLVMDTKGKGWIRLIGSAAIRVGAILLAVVAAGGVLDLIFFEQPIERRIEEENLRWFLVAMSTELYERELALEDHETQRATAQAEAEELQQAEARLPKLKRELQATEGAVSGARASLELLDQQKQTTLSAVEQLTNRLVGAMDVPEEDSARIQNRLLVLRNQLEETKQSIVKQEGFKASAGLRATQLRDSIKAIEERINNLRKKRKDRLSAQDLEDKKHREEQRKSRKALQHWVDRYRIAAEKESLLDDPAITGLLGEESTPPRPDVFQRYRILNDLKAGAPPLWPPTTTSNVERLRQEFNLLDPPRCSEVPPGQKMPDHCRSARVYWFGFWLLFGVAALVPSMALLMKVALSSEDTKAYYSRVHQAAVGNSDALEQLAADQNWGRVAELKIEVAHE